MKIFLILNLILLHINFAISNIQIYEDKVDLVIYSFDRPMQLYALLESINKYIIGLSEVHIIYRVSNENFNNAYEEVKKKFSAYLFHKQGKNPYQDFKPLVMQCAFGSSGNYILFAVDDIIIKDFVDINKCIKAMQKSNAYGFYLRLGKNLTETYSTQNIEPASIPIPPHEHLEDDIFTYTFKNGIYGWSYANCNDMAIYKKNDIKEAFEKMHFVTTAYESSWSGMVDLNRKGLFFANSKMVNIPINAVMEEIKNPHFNLFTVEELLEKFNQGLKINIEPFYKIKNKCAHQNYNVEFIKR